MTAALHCRGLTVFYGDGPALRGLDLEVRAGEAMALLGPSGAGKTTLLHTVAGFLDPAAGEVWVDGRLAAGPGVKVPVEQRPVGMVFQQFALWPHLSALDTVAYPIRRRGLGRATARTEAARLLERVGIPELADRLPAELSGGQQQRVGLARALARQAKLYLFDEPTAHLDAALRGALQEEIAAQRAAQGAAALIATHDAAEALAVADRVALLRDGSIVQVGSPAEIYSRPVDVWAARLTGPASVITAEVAGPSAVRLAGEFVEVAATLPETGSAELLVRPDWASLGGPLPGTVTAAWFRGPHTDYRLATPAGEVDLREPGPPRAKAGEAVTWTLRRVWPLGGSSRGERG